MDKVTHIFLRDPELVERLEKTAAAEHRTRTAVVIRALERYLADQREKKDAE